MQPARARLVYDAISIASLIAIGAAASWSTTSRDTRSIRSATATPAQLLSLANAPTLGSASAPIALIVFSDFQCPFCRTFARRTLPSIIEKYVRTGKLIVAFRHFPLDSIHPDARRAAELAECAQRMGRFWELHDAIFEDTTGFDGDWLMRIATGISLPPVAFAGCSAAGVAERVREDGAMAAMLEVTSTPTIFLGLNGADARVTVARVLKGSSTAELMHHEIESLLDSGKSR